MANLMVRVQAGRDFFFVLRVCDSCSVSTIVYKP